MGCGPTTAERCGRFVANYENTRVYRRLGIVKVGRLTKSEELVRDADDLDREGYRDLAAQVRQIAENPAAVKALEARAGRPRRSERRADIALDYLATRTIFGRGKFGLAKGEVAHIWSTSEESVESCWSDFQHYARFRLEQIEASHLVPECDGISNHFTSRRKLLAALSADLRDIHGVNVAESSKNTT